MLHPKPAGTEADSHPVTATPVVMPSGFVPGLLLPFQNQVELPWKSCFVQMSWIQVSKIAVESYV